MRCLVVLATLAAVQGCTVVAIGKKASSDGSTILAHTDDNGSGAADIRLIRVPAADHPEGSMRDVYLWENGNPRILTDKLGPQYKPLAGEQPTTPIGQIPQIAHTYAYWDADYGLQNEHQLSIAESTTSAKTVGWALDKPYGYNLWGIDELSKVALERCVSARCAISLMGELAEKGGFYSADSGDPAHPGYADSAEALAVSDKFGEVWIFNILTGANNASAVWAAQRVPDDEAHITANSFSIRTMNLSDSDNYMASSNVVTFAQEMGWYDPNKDGEFDFMAAYAQETYNDPISPLYTGRRVWRFYQLFTPSKPFDPYLGVLPKRPSYPFSLAPDKPITVASVFTFLRDHFEGTEFDMTKGMGAGPFNNPMRYEGPSPYPPVFRDGGYAPSSGGWERAVSIYRTSFALVIQTRPHLPDAVGGRFWMTEDAPHGSAFIPFYGAQNSVPTAWSARSCTQAKYSRDCAYWAFAFVNNWIQLKYSFMIRDVRTKQFAVEGAGWEMLETAEADVMRLYDNRTDSGKSGKSNKSVHNEVVSRLEKATNKFAEDALAQWWEFGDMLIAKYANGEVTIGEGEHNQGLPGYPRWWLANTEYVTWPGHTFIYPEGTPKQRPETPPVAANVTFVALPTSFEPTGEHSINWKSEQQGHSFADAREIRATNQLQRQRKDGSPVAVAPANMAAVAAVPFSEGTSIGAVCAVALLVAAAFVVGVKYGESRRRSDYTTLA